MMSSCVSSAARLEFETRMRSSQRLGAREIVEKAMKIAGDICIYTNNSVVYEELV